MDGICSSFIRFQCILHDSGVIFSEFLNFFKLAREVLVSGTNQFCRKCELFDPPPLLYVNFKSFMDNFSSSFFRFQCIPHDSGVLCADSWNLYKSKRGDLLSGGNQFCRKWDIWSPFLYFNFKSFAEPNSSSFIRFQCILHDSGVHFSESWNY